MTPRRKVLVMIDSLYPGGAERAVVGLAMSLPSDRYEVTVCATRRHEGTLADELTTAGVRYVTLGRQGRFDVLPFWRLLRILRGERFDVVHAHKFGSNLWGSIIGRLAGTPAVVAHEHSWSYEGQLLRRLLDRHVIARLADVLVAVSTRDRERMTSVEHIPPSKTMFIPNAFIPPAPGEVPSDVRAELGLTPETPLIGTLAMLRAEKAIEVMLEAFAMLTVRVPSAHLAIGGSGPCEKQWQDLARTLGVADRVHWLGVRGDGHSVVNALDVAALSSNREGMPMFALEAMAAAKPLVATDVGGLRDIFEDGVGALLVPPRDAPAMAAAFERLIADPELRASMGATAHARLPEFTTERAVERITALYESLLSRPRRGRRR